MTSVQEATMELVRARNKILEAREVLVKTPVSPGEQADLSRMLDSIAESAVALRGWVEHPGNGAAAAKRRARQLKSVRKALGYTYP